jgi:hypothetical protein
MPFAARCSQSPLLFAGARLVRATAAGLEVFELATGRLTRAGHFPFAAEAVCTLDADRIVALIKPAENRVGEFLVIDLSSGAVDSSSKLVANEIQSLVPLGADQIIATSGRRAAVYSLSDRKSAAHLALLELPNRPEPFDRRAGDQLVRAGDHLVYPVSDGFAVFWPNRPIVISKIAGPLPLLVTTRADGRIWYAASSKLTLADLESSQIEPPVDVGPGRVVGLASNGQSAAAVIGVSARPTDRLDIAVVSDSGGIRWRDVLLDSATRRSLRPAIAFGPNHVAASVGDSGIIVWDASSGRRLVG